MEALFISIGVVALAEIGDKTQLLAFYPGCSFLNDQSPFIMGIFVATLMNHGLAGAVGIWITKVISPDRLQWIIGISFFCMAIWTLIPDKMETQDIHKGRYLGIFGATFGTFFLAEMGDKTQIATIALTAHYSAPILVITGTTIGMLLADVPAVLLGNKSTEKIPMKLVHVIAASIFALMGLFTLFF